MLMVKNAGFCFRERTVAVCTQVFLEGMIVFTQARSTIPLILMPVAHNLSSSPHTYFIPDPYIVP